MEIDTRPVWAEVSTENLVRNYRYLQGLAGPGSDLLAVVKANAYGHGLEICAPALSQAGAEWLGITSVEEGVALRQLCPASRILVMTGIWKGQARAALEHRLSPVVWNRSHFEELQQASADRRPGTIPVHLELDTGMSRQGIPVQEDTAELAEILHRFFSPSSPFLLEGLMTHFSAAEDFEKETNRVELERLGAAIEVVAAQGLRPTWLHAGSSVTLLANRGRKELEAMAGKLGARLMLRPGLALYGCWPRFAPPEALGLSSAEARPVLCWKASVTALREIGEGLTVGYNGTFTTKKRTRLALVAVGYADGLSRSLSNRFSLLVRGQRAPIAGRISMDHTILDVTEIPEVEVGDEVVLLGQQGTEHIAAQDQADVLGTIPWEILCDIACRVVRKAV